VGHAATGTIRDVEHVVILMQENRSFDHYFGALKGVHGFNDQSTLLLRSGKNVFFQPNGPSSVTPFHAPTLLLDDIRHDWIGEHEFWNLGQWDRWVVASGPATMAYYTRADLPFYYGLADAYTVCDANYCSVMGPTFPNRVYLFTGRIEPNRIDGRYYLDNSVPTNGFGWTTYPERLQAAGISWKVYRPLGDWFGDALAWFTQFQNARPGEPLYDRGVLAVSDVAGAFRRDVTNGTLPQVSWIVTPWSISEHPAESPNSGENFVRELLETIASKPAVYASTVFILTYDENGGFFDHVPAPVPPPGTTNEFVDGQPIGLGVRVPMVLISPWTRGGRVCSQVFDHTSILRFLEIWTGVSEPNISAWRRQVCGDLTSAFDFAHPDNSPPPLPVPDGSNGLATEASGSSSQSVTAQEAGTRMSMPLPYQPNANASINGAARRFGITLTNSGTASVHFSVHANADPAELPRPYDVRPRSATTDSFGLPSDGEGQYDFTCLGPNGFERRFAGNFQADRNVLEIASTLHPNTGCLTLDLQNWSADTVHFAIADGYGLAATQTIVVPPGSIGSPTYCVKLDNNGWYDLTVTADVDPQFLRRLAGHIESRIPMPTATNASGFSNFPLPPGPTNPPAFVLPDFLSPVPDTNSLKIYGALHRNNFVLIYPAWASNHVIESFVNLPPAIPGEIIVPTNFLGSFPYYRAVPLPIESTGRLFRLRR
jgi:phospholipase C